MAQVTLQQACELATRHCRAGERDRAQDLYRQLISHPLDRSEDLQTLARLALELGHTSDAKELLRRAIVLNPGAADCHANLGTVLATCGQIDEAIAAFEAALALSPESAQTWNNLANAFRAKGLLDAAVRAYRRAIALRADFVEAYNNLGKTLQSQWKWEEAAEAWTKVTALRPDDADAHNNLGIVLRETGNLDRAVASFRAAMALRPKPTTLSNLLHTLMFQPQCDAAALLNEHRAWDQQFARPLRAHVRHHDNDPDPARRLRVGYVSPNFRQHPVGRFLLPLMENHNHGEFEVVCYSDVTRPDALTERLCRSADIWRSTVGISDQELADLVRDDRIDILVDLTMHMGDNRLLAFARKPAPAQVTYLAYCGTTGLEAMDYRLTDGYLDPPAAPPSKPRDDRYGEKSVRFPVCYWCYSPLEQAPPPGPPPVLSAWHVTFGCLNHFLKVSPQALDAWRELLCLVPGSRLILYCEEGSQRQRTRQLLTRGDIDPTRVEFVPFLSKSEYFAKYQRIDIALDPFPYAGGTTTCDALWMGVPVVSLAGDSAVSRAGLSILSNVGLPELVAGSVQQYVKIAADLAADLPRLAALHRDLRGKMQSSPLMDAPRFARDVESAFRSMWAEWCESNRRPPNT